MKIEDLPSSAGLSPDVARPEMDPFTEENALQEAQLLDVRFDALRLTVGLLFELRMALQLRVANTGVLVAHGVRELSWLGPHRSTKLTAWSIGGSLPRTESQLFRLQLGMWPAPGAQLIMVAEHAAFFVGDVPDLKEVPPDYADGDGVSVASELAGWRSEFVLAQAVFFDALPE